MVVVKLPCSPITNCYLIIIRPLNMVITCLGRLRLCRCLLGYHLSLVAILDGNQFIIMGFFTNTGLPAVGIG